MLFDSFNRIHNYLRISLTDSCNFRCHYCMPDGPQSCMPHERLMQTDEIFQIAETFAGLGVKKIRLTGGEPLVRVEFEDILRRLAALPVELTLTTNGVLLDRFLDALKESGVRSLNISIDSLKPEAFKAITRRDQFHRVWNNILLMLEHGFGVKLNAVVMRGVNDGEINDFVRLTRELPVHVRFIEFMPFDGNAWETGKVITAAEMLQSVVAEFDVVKLVDEPHATARKHQAIGHQGTFAFITTMSHQFCGDCNRMRLTADGKMKNCLFGKEETDILGAFRRGEPIEPLIRESLSRKHAALGGQMAADHREVDAAKLEQEYDKDRRLNMFFAENAWLILFALMPLAAFLYASVGHGGASSYLMLLALFGFAPEQIRPTALALNIIVSFISFLSYRKTCKFPRQLFLALVLFSVPAAFLGGTVQLDAVWYKRILGFLLLFPILRFLNLIPVAREVVLQRQWWMAPVLGLLIGFASGLIGIGGGIILSPVLLLLGWANMRETAAVSALFIFVNSIAGLAGANPFGVRIDLELWALAPLTVAAGALGAWYGAKKFNVVTVRYVLTSVLAFAAIKLMMA